MKPSPTKPTKPVFNKKFNISSEYVANIRSFENNEEEKKTKQKLTSKKKPPGKLYALTFQATFQCLTPQQMTYITRGNYRCLF